MRISDWSSDLCSSDLLNIVVEFLVEARRGEGTRLAEIIFERQVSLIGGDRLEPRIAGLGGILPVIGDRIARSEEHTSELQSLMRISYAVFCLKKKNNQPFTNDTHQKRCVTPHRQ